MPARLLLNLSLPAILAVAGAVYAAQSDSAQPSEHQHDPAMAGMHHHDQVNQRGDAAMGFSHLKTTHHFRLSPLGGAIEVQANDPADTASRDQIRAHLEKIATAFKNGDFSSPMLTHGRTPPGVPAMQRLKETIDYRFSETKAGGKVLISTSNREALQAIHEFLRFQIEDHQTGDPTGTAK